MSQSQQPSRCSYLKTLVTTPWTTRTYLLTLLTLAFLDQYYDKWSYMHLSSNFFLTLINVEPWRGFVNFLYEPNLVVCIIVIVHLGYYLPKFQKQKQNGSIILLYELVTIGLLVQFFVICYEAVIYMLNDNQIIDQWKVTYEIGAGGLFINIYMKLLYHSFREQSSRSMTPKGFFAYMYPLFLTVVSSMLCNQLRIDMITGYILSLIQCLVFRGGIIFYTPDTYSKKQRILTNLRCLSIPFCQWSPLNQQKTKANRLGVVQANQFYTLTENQQRNNAVRSQQLHQIQIQTQRGAFHRSIDDLSVQGKGEKWQQTEIIEDE